MFCYNAPAPSFYFDFKRLLISTHPSPSLRPKVKAPAPRLWEIDALRGVAILLMVLYHTIFYLDFFFESAVSSQGGFWYWEGRVSAILFMVLLGVASALIAQRYKGWEYAQKQWKRGLQLVVWGMAVTLATWFLLREWTIWFGILHFLGLSTWISAPVADKKFLNLALALMALVLGRWIHLIEWNPNLGVILGAPPAGYQTLDYYPLFPRLAWVFLGIFLGNLIYSKKEPLLKKGPKRVGQILSWLGQKSLWIYLIHPPLLFGVLWLIFKFHSFYPVVF